MQVIVSACDEVFAQMSLVDGSNASQAVRITMCLVGDAARDVRLTPFLEVRWLLMHFDSLHSQTLTPGSGYLAV